MANKSKKRIKHDFRVKYAELEEHMRLRNAIEYGRIHCDDEYRIEVMAAEAYICCDDVLYGKYREWDYRSVPEDIKKGMREMMMKSFLADENGCVEYRMMPVDGGVRCVAKLAVLKPKPGKKVVRGEYIY